VGGGEWAQLLENAGYEVFVAAEPQALPQRDQRFDAVLARHLLPRLGAPHRALQEWVRVLRPGGRLVLLEEFPARSRFPWPRFGFGRERRFDPPRCRDHRAAPFRGGLRAGEAITLLSLADLWDVRCYDLGALHGGGSPYLVRARRP
jgi:SAM-dependent methyltransferase